jgi:hypothetical protein
LTDHDEERVVKVKAGDNSLVQEVHRDGATTIEHGSGKTLAPI